MTYEEYKKLVKECRETDSVKRRDEIKRDVRTQAIAVCENLEKLHNKWGSEFVDDSDYQIGKGGYSLNSFDSTDAHLTYSDHWAYGGECSIGIQVPMKYLDVENRKKKNAELRKNRIIQLQNQYHRNELEIGRMKKECEDILANVSRLKAEQEADQYFTPEDDDIDKEDEGGC